MNNYYVYIISNSNNTVLYIGVTKNLIKRIDEHKRKLFEGFSNNYSLTKLVYYEVYDDINIAIDREKKLKKWNRQWKDNLIDKVNINRIDLYGSLLE